MLYSHTQTQKQTQGSYLGKDSILPGYFIEIEHSAVTHLNYYFEFCVVKGKFPVSTHLSTLQIPKKLLRENQHKVPPLGTYPILALS